MSGIHFPTAQTMPNFFAPFSAVDMNRLKPARYCQCGTRLRRTKPQHRTQCDACETKTTPAPIELHPDIHRTQTCPSCGTPIHRGAVTCRTCYEASPRIHR